MSFGVEKIGNKIVAITQEAVDNAQSFRDLLGDATEIGDDAFANLDLSKWCINKSPVVATKCKAPMGRNASRYNRTVNVQSDIYIPASITKIGDRAFKGVKGVQIIEVGYRSFDSLGSAAYAYGCTEFGDEAFANIEGLQMVCIGADPSKVQFGKNVFSGNNFINEFNHFTHAFGGFKNGLWGFSSLKDINQKITNFQSSLDVKTISPTLSGEVVAEDQKLKTGLADMINMSR